MATPRFSAASPASAFLSLLAECGCTLCRQGLVLPARDAPSFLHKLELRLKSDASLHQNFLSGLQDFISDDSNLRRLLNSFAGDGQGIVSTDSLARLLLSVAAVQTQVANILLEKLPEHCAEAGSSLLPGLRDSIPRLILNQFRWLDYLIDAENLTSKLMEVLSICPTPLQKEIISLIPEIASDDVHELIVGTLEQMLQGDSQLIAPVLDAFSNLNLKEELLDQVVSLAIVSLRTSDAEDLPLVVRFLLQSATAANVRRIVHQLRENLQFTSEKNAAKAAGLDMKMKGKSIVKNCESLVLETLRSGLRFQNVMCEAILKEIRGLDQVQDHKVIDFWLLLIIYANGGSYKKLADSIVKRKAIGGLFGKNLLSQSVRGRLALLQDYFQYLLSMSHGLLACKENAARQLGSHAYVLLFEEFKDAYHRQEVLGSLVTHTGSGVDYEVSSALDALIVISSNYSEELLVLSSFINGILDYLEGFQDNHLHQVYKVFGQLALATWAHGPVTRGSSMANELLIVLRKQITNPDATYKRMGIIGVIKLISCLGHENNLTLPSGTSTQTSVNETFGLLQLIMEMCKTSCVARGFFYDELAVLCETVSLDASITEWISKQTVEFESLFLVDLEAGNVPAELKSSESLEGNAWMNLDGEVSPILLNIQNLLMSDGTSSTQALVFLPSSFRLLATVERATNNGSLGNIDALLGCPLYLPAYQILVGDEWQDLSPNLKETACIAIFHAINWIRELINTYSTQIQATNENLTQATREEISAKILKRMRNITFFELLLGDCMKSVPLLSFPVLHSETEKGNGLIQRKNILRGEPAAKKHMKRKAADVEEVPNASANQAERNSSQISSGREKQTKLPDCFSGKAKDTLTQVSSHSQLPSTGTHPTGNGKDSGTTNVKERSERAGQLEEQRWKFRPLSVHSLSILSIPQGRPSPGCCPDPCAELPLYLYILRDLHHKLECLDKQTRKTMFWAALPSCNPKPPSGLGPMTATEFLKILKPIFPSLRKHLDTAAKILRGGSGCTLNNSCEEHWNKEALDAGNPEGGLPMVSQHATAGSVLAVTIRCLSKVFSNPELICEHMMSTLMELLSAFGTMDSEEKFLLDLHPPPSAGSLEYALCSAYTHLDELFDAAASTSFSVTTDLIMAQKALVSCAERLLEISKETMRRKSGFFRSTGFLPYLKTRLSVSAGRVLRHEWEDEGHGKCWRNRGDLIQPLVQIFLQFNDSPLELLEELASNVMPQVPAQKTRATDPVHAYPTLCQGNMLVWYRVQHEELSKIFSKAVKDASTMHKSKTAKEDDINLVLVHARQCATVLVSLVNLTKIHCDKVAIHSVAVKFGGKFIDIFLKGNDVWQAQYAAHKDSINAVIKELQKATRTIQTLCSEAKGSKKLPVTSKIPAVKRSLERYVFCIKALLHSVSQGNSFWMGNLKHKNLRGEEIGSQLPVSDEERGEAVSIDEDDENAEQVDLDEGEAERDASDET
ncbi:hypothetical protein GOP47_0016422 [Adiantum capillus-veneris]|uniref:Fanconi anemia group D2 protein n=1 Tax=Adiantum capillus-veneris TaxID=13818 RepID=A0A9D4ZBQ6_ADICA|nr:hypothetical protein GOP47_0016422 [Adiantum capillus-veneris]